MHKMKKNAKRTLQSHSSRIQRKSKEIHFCLRSMQSNSLLKMVRFHTIIAITTSLPLFPGFSSLDCCSKGAPAGGTKGSNISVDFPPLWSNWLWLNLIVAATQCIFLWLPPTWHTWCLGSFVILQDDGSFFLLFFPSELVGWNCDCQRKYIWESVNKNDIWEGNPGDRIFDIALAVMQIFAQLLEGWNLLDPPL